NWLDSSSVKAYIEATDRIRPGNPEKAFAQYQQALAVSRSSGMDKATLYCLTRIGEFHFNKGNYTQSLKFLYEALPYCGAVTTNMRWIVPSVYNLIGTNYHYTGYSDSALIYYTQALRFLDSLNIDNPLLAAQITSNLAATLATARQYDQAALYMSR